MVDRDHKDTVHQDPRDTLDKAHNTVDQEHKTLLIIITETLLITEKQLISDNQTPTYRNYFFLPKVVALCLMRMMNIRLLESLGRVPVPW